MPSTPKYLALFAALVVVLAACASTADSAATTSESDAVLDTSEISDETDETDETVSEDAVPAEEVTEDDLGDESTDADTILCDAPESANRYVDVALDDPDGGLNLRLDPGVDGDIIGVFPRSSEVVTTGECQTIGVTDWWQVVPGEGQGEDGIGWVSSSFLSPNLVFNPGLGKAINDTDNIGLGGESLDEMIRNIASTYGFDDDVVITMIGEPVGADAQGGSVSYNLTGLKDDASDGYQVDIDFILDKNEDENGEIESYTAAKITRYALCTRGVTDDGLCV